MHYVVYLDEFGHIGPFVSNHDVHASAQTFKRQLLQTVRKIDRFCSDEGATFMVLLDEQQAGDEWRERNVEACTLAMFEDSAQKSRTLVEPPLQGDRDK